MNGRAEIVQKSRQRERKRAGAAACHGFGLKDVDLYSGLCQGDGSCEAVWACSNNDGPFLRSRHNKSVYATAIAKCAAHSIGVRRC